MKTNIQEFILPGETLRRLLQMCIRDRCTVVQLGLSNFMEQAEATLFLLRSFVFTVSLTTVLDTLQMNWCNYLIIKGCLQICEEKCQRWLATPLFIISPTSFENSCHHFVKGKFTVDSQYLSVFPLGIHLSVQKAFIRMIFGILDQLCHCLLYTSRCV